MVNTHNKDLDAYVMPEKSAQICDIQKICVPLVSKYQGQLTIFDCFHNFQTVEVLRLNVPESE